MYNHPTNPRVHIFSHPALGCVHVTLDFLFPENTHLRES